MAKLPEVPEYDNRLSFHYKGVKYGMSIPGDPRDIDFNSIIRNTADNADKGLKNTYLPVRAVDYYVKDDCREDARFD